MMVDETRIFLFISFHYSIIPLFHHSIHYSGILR